MSGVSLGPVLQTFDSREKAVAFAKANAGNEAIREVKGTDGKLTYQVHAFKGDLAQLSGLRTSEMDYHVVAFVDGDGANAEKSVSATYTEKSIVGKDSAETKKNLTHLIDSIVRDGKVNAEEYKYLASAWNDVREQYPDIVADLLPKKEEVEKLVKDGGMVLAGTGMAADGGHFYDPVAALASLDQNELNGGNTELCAPYCLISAAMLQGPGAVEKLAHSAGLSLNAKDGLSVKEVADLAKKLYAKAFNGSPPNPPVGLTGDQTLALAKAGGLTGVSVKSDAKSLENQQVGETRIFPVDKLEGHAIHVTRTAEGYVAFDSDHGADAHGTLFKTQAEAEAWLNQQPSLKTA